MQKDIAEKNLEWYNDVFSDIVNGLLFNGIPVLKEENLTSLPTESNHRNLDGTLREGRRDIRKVDKEHGEFRLIIALENQTDYDNTMPERVMGYEYASYEEQIREWMELNRKENRPAYSKRIHDDQKLAPVITLVLNFGEDAWNGPKELYDMLRFPDEIGEQIKPFIANYPLNIIDVRHLSAGERECLQSDFRFVAEFLSCQNVHDAENFLHFGKEHPICHPEELLDVLSSLSKNKYQRTIIQKIIHETQTNDHIDTREDETMFIDVFDYVTEKGIQQGIQQGEERLNALNIILIREKRYDDLERAATDKEYRKSLMEQYQL